MAAEKRKRESGASEAPAASTSTATPAVATEPKPQPKNQRQPRPPPRGKQKKTFSESFGTSHLLDLALSIASGRDAQEQERVDHAKEVRAALDDAAKKRKVAREHKKKGTLPATTAQQAKGPKGKTPVGKSKSKGKDGDDDAEEQEFEEVEKAPRSTSLPPKPAGEDLPALKSKAAFRNEIKQKERERAKNRKNSRKQNQRDLTQPGGAASKSAGSKPSSADSAPTAKRRRVAFA
ncbi:unnamed protein product [Tilletia controversa]|uniref:Uncharacterized protein n=3 Tax=Tilletia TaxID=13289 RepID=A0A8X7SVQ7_9BASI|nr:hypothetical protein CF336_g5709 [Tilletia laevis]KAE8193164.1 hypothetical protein CF328_g5127 [Tilletia controversa]KAE8256989.1 hypothetical protein A4X03_0g4855 [Tilletia caries]KAE8196597.1 hypothetical protein CF335_g4819 [Tilletia laevis]KAE8244938.1 hypothetical protein A4X06_0g5896 [Tilletia controversa]